MKPPLFGILALFLLTLARPAAGQVSKNFQLVGQNPLFNRRMNAALTIFQDFLYVGNRTDVDTLPRCFDADVQFVGIKDVTEHHW
jgi:hypothetical protein